MSPSSRPFSPPTFRKPSREQRPEKGTKAVEAKKAEVEAAREALKAYDEEQR